MCIGIPMQVVRVEAGFAHVRSHIDDNATQRVETALITPPQVGDWLLVFIDSARDIISAERAAEICQTHQLLAQVMGGQGTGSDAVDFALPSQMDARTVQQLTGQNNG